MYNNPACMCHVMHACMPRVSIKRLACSSSTLLSDCVVTTLFTNSQSTHYASTHTHVWLSVCNYDHMIAITFLSITCISSIDHMYT